MNQPVRQTQSIIEATYVILIKSILIQIKHFIKLIEKQSVYNWNAGFHPFASSS